LDPDYLAYRVGQTAYLLECLTAAGIPCIRPAGGHAVYIDALSLLSHIPRSEFPGWALSVALYAEGGIRGAEMGTIAFADKDDQGRWRFPELELVRLAIPRRVYTQAHLDFVAEVAARIQQTSERIAGYRLTYEPPFLRHFTAEFEPLVEKG
jgi:tryptophanase